MKVGIIGDTHFGASFVLGKIDGKTQLNSRLLDFEKTFNSIIDCFVENSVEHIFITGDVFESRHPTSAQLNVFSKCIRRAFSFGLKIHIVVGNHDQQRTTSTTTIDSYNSLGLPEISVYSDISVCTIKDDKESVDFIMLPYRDRQMMGTNNNQEAVIKIKEDVDNVVKNLSKNNKKVVIGHFMVDKAVTGISGENFSISEIIVPSEIFFDFDAVIMGHVHQYSLIRKKNPLVMYIGSMEKNTFVDKDCDKISIILDTDNISDSKIVKTDVREMFEINFDYSDEEDYKDKVTDNIISNIDVFAQNNDLEGSIVKLVVKIKENDYYYINQCKIRQHIRSKGVQHAVPMQISTVSNRKFRNKNINETVDEKKAVFAYIKSLSESSVMKKKLVKAANSIIEEVDEE